VSLELHGHLFSSYTWKALIALYANGTTFEFREIDMSVPKFESFTGKAHPSGQFPVLTDGEAVVVETSAIIEHLAVHHPGPAPLIPADPADAVVTRMIDRVFDQYVMGNLQRIMAAYFVDKDDPAAGGLRDEPYAPEIAAAMLQRQQAGAIIAARQRIVEGAVGMVEMALEMLSHKGIVQLDEERKAAMVSNLLVVLCGEKAAQPIVNTGTIHQ